MARAPYSIFSRKNTKGESILCARFFDSSGAVFKTVSLPDVKANRKKAILEAEKMLKEGVVSNADNPDALEYLKEFWSRDSAYVKGRALRGKVLSENYLYNSREIIELHLSKYLTGKKLLDLTPALMEKAIQGLAASGVGPRRINIALQSVRVPFAHFCRQHSRVNNLLTVEKVDEKTSAKTRGVLSLEEFAKILALENPDPRAFLGTLLGALCGMRLGEIRGLRWSDVDEAAGMISIENNFVNSLEGEKAPKWGSSRSVPIPGPVLDALKACGEAYPSKYKKKFVLWNQRTPTSPVTVAGLRHGFNGILESIGIFEEERVRRNLVFHGLRHFFVSMCRSQGIPDFIVQAMVGHSTESMKITDDYSHANTVDFQTARAKLESVVGWTGGQKNG